MEPGGAGGNHLYRWGNDLWRLPGPAGRGPLTPDAPQALPPSPGPGFTPGREFGGEGGGVGPQSCVSPPRELRAPMHTEMFSPRTPSCHGLLGWKLPALGQGGKTNPRPSLLARHRAEGTVTSSGKDRRAERIEKTPFAPQKMSLLGVQGKRRAVGPGPAASTRVSMEFTPFLVPRGCPSSPRAA